MRLTALAFFCLCLTASAQFDVQRDKRVGTIQTEITALQSYQTTATSRITAQNTGIDLIENNIFINALRLSVNTDLLRYDMSDGFVDAYEDQTGIDLGSGSNFIYDATSDYYAYNDVPNNAFDVSANQNAHLKCEDNAGNTTVTDSSATASDWTSLRNTSLFTTTGKIGNGFIFDNASSVTPATDSLQNTNQFGYSWLTNVVDRDFTISCWATSPMWESTSEAHSMGGWRDSDANPSIYFGFHYSGGLQFRMRDDNADELAVLHDSTVFANNSWHFFVMTWDASEDIMSAYVDGSLSGRATNTSFDTVVQVEPLDYMAMGSQVYHATNEDYGWDGKLDEIRIHDRVLTDAEITSLYFSGYGTTNDSSGATGQMELISTNGYNATSAPTESRVLILHEEVSGTPTLNTDIKAWSSSDAGSTWDQVTLSNLGELSSGIDIFAGTNALTGASTNMEYRITTHSSTNQGRFHGAGLLWK